MKKEIMVDEVTVAGYIPCDDLRDEAIKLLKFIVSRTFTVAEKIGHFEEEDPKSEQYIVATELENISAKAHKLLSKIRGFQGRKTK